MHALYNWHGVGNVKFMILDWREYINISFKSHRDTRFKSSPVSGAISFDGVNVKMAPFLRLCPLLKSYFINTGNTVDYYSVPAGSKWFGTRKCTYDRPLELDNTYIEHGFFGGIIYERHGFICFSPPKLLLSFSIVWSRTLIKIVHEL